MQLDRLDEIDLAEIELKRKDDDVVTALVRKVRDLTTDLEDGSREIAALHHRLSAYQEEE
jgi:hypothetical protein